MACGITQTEKFVNWWFSHVPEGLFFEIRYRIKKTKPEGQDIVKSKFFSSASEVVEYCKNPDKADDYWFGLQPRKTRGGKGSDVAGFYFYGFDFDHEKKDDKTGTNDEVYKACCEWGKGAAACLLEPHETQILTSGNCIQVILAHPVKPLSEIETPEHAKKTMELGKKILELAPLEGLYTDEVKDAARVLRLPGFANPKGGRIAQLLAQTHEKELSNPDFTPPKSKSLDAALSKKIPARKRYNYFIHLAGLMASRKWEKEAARAALIEFNSKNCADPAPEFYIDNALSSYESWLESNKKVDEPTTYTKNETTEQPVEVFKPSAEALLLAKERLKDKNLLIRVKEELDKRHIGDTQEKLFCYMLTKTAHLPNPRERKSLCIKGDSSVGKDNLIDSLLYLTPPDKAIKVTRATASALEDDITKYPIVAFSELNADKENGANIENRETIKQMAEGGTRTLKKNLHDGFKTAQDTTQEQKTVVYGTTADDTDEELATRFVMVTIRSNSDKVNSVNNSTLKNASDPYKYFKSQEKPEDNWLVAAHTLLEPKDVILPCVDTLISPKPEEAIFDTKSPRSQRDLKRLISISKAIAWLHQKQRPTVEFGGQSLIVGLPCDFLNAVTLGDGFFELSYHGFDGRVKDLLDYINKNPEGLTLKQLQEFQGCRARNTLNSRLKVIDNLGLIERVDTPGKPTLVKPTQDPLKTLSNPIKIDIIKERISRFVYTVWEKRNNIKLSGSDRVLTYLNNPSTDVKVGTLSIFSPGILPSTQTSSNNLNVVSGRTFEGVKIDRVDPAPATKEVIYSKIKDSNPEGISTSILTDSSRDELAKRFIRELENEDKIYFENGRHYAKEATQS